MEGIIDFPFFQLAELISNSVIDSSPFLLWRLRHVAARASSFQSDSRRSGDALWVHLSAVWWTCFMTRWGSSCVGRIIATFHLKPATAICVSSHEGSTKHHFLTSPLLTRGSDFNLKQSKSKASTWGGGVCGGLRNAVIPQRQPAPSATRMAACLCLLHLEPPLSLFPPQFRCPSPHCEASFALGDCHVEVTPSPTRTHPHPHKVNIYCSVKGTMLLSL